MTDSVVAAETLVIDVVTTSSQDVVAVDVVDLAVVTMGQQGPSGPAGPAGGATYTYPAGTGAISGHRVVTLDSGHNAIYASNDTLAHANKLLGVTLNAALASDPVNVQRLGELTEPSWNWTPDLPVYLGKNGHLTQTPPSAADSVFSVVVGFPVTSTTLFVSIGNPIILTA